MIRKRNEQLAKTVIKGLQSRNMSGYYAEDKEAALKQALELIPEGSTIAMGGCMSAGEIGLISALEAGNYHYIDRSKMDARAGLMAAYDADIFLFQRQCHHQRRCHGQYRRQFQPCLLHSPGTEESNLHRRHEQGLRRLRQRHEACEKRGCTYQRPEIRHQDSLQGDRKMLRL